MSDEDEVDTDDDGELDVEHFPESSALLRDAGDEDDESGVGSGEPPAGTPRAKQVPDEEG